MEKQAVEIFSRIIDVYADKILLQKECLENETSQPPFKTPRLEQPGTGTNEVTSSYVIEQLLEECLSSKSDTVAQVEHSLQLQFQGLITQYKSGAPYNREMKRSLVFITSVLEKKAASLEQCSQMLFHMPEVNKLPLNFIWHLSQLKLFSLHYFLTRIKEPNNVTRLVEDALNLILKKSLDDSVESVLKDFLSSLIFISYEFSSKNFQSLQQTANSLLSELLPKFLDAISVTEEKEKEGSSCNKQFINVYKLMQDQKTLDTKSLKQFYSSQLIIILTFKPEVRLSVAIEQHHKWRSTKSNKILSQVLFAIIKGLGSKECFDTLDKVVSSLEVNWSFLLSFLGNLLLADSNSAPKLRGVIEQYLRRGCNEHETEYLILGFLFARHASMEGRHIFPTYSQWFGATFGSEASSPANKKQTFCFLVNFLTSLVPFETMQILRAHLHQSIFVPKGCQAIFRDYQRLARVRLQELSEDGSELSEGGQGSGFNPRPEQKTNKTLSEVESAVTQFEATSRVPSFVLEAAIFKRPYFLSSFLPALLVPRVLPDVPDLKMKLIDQLVSMSKIPPKIHSTYLEKCQKLSGGHPINDDVEVLEQVPFPKRVFLTLQKLMNDFVALVLKAGTEEDVVVSQSLIILSKITEAMEGLTSVPDEGFKDAMCLVVNPRDFDPDSVLYQVFEEILIATEKLVGHPTPSNGSAAISKLCVVLCSSPSMQKAFLTGVLHYFKESLQVFSSKVETFGVLLCELMDIGGIFLPVKLATSPSANSLAVTDLLLDNLFWNTIENLYFSCCFMKACVEWDLKVKRNSTTSSKEGKRINLRHLYFALAARVAIMNWNGREGITFFLIQPSFVNRLPLIEGARVPVCCQVLVEKFPEIMESVVFKDWIAFELEADWGPTPLDFRLRHLRFWFHLLLRLPSSESPENKFLFVFWKLVEERGVTKNNSAELLILLQRYAFDERPSISLIREWSERKKSLFLQGDEMESKREYKVMLSSFISLCHCLPAPLFVGDAPSMAPLRLFPNIVSDTLEMEESLFLSLKETSFFLECFANACSKRTPNESLVQSCFNFRPSVLFHLKHLAPLLSRLSILNKYTVTSFFTIDISRPVSFSMLPKRDSGPLLSASLLQGTENFASLTFPSKECKSFVFRLLTEIFGRQLLYSGNFDSAFENSKDRFNVTSENSNTIKKMEISVSSVLDSLVPATGRQLKDSDPLGLMDGWEQEAETSLSWKTFQLGFSQIILTKMKGIENGEIKDEKAIWFFCMFLLCFHHLTKIFEKSENETCSPSLDYLSLLNGRIFYVIDVLPPASFRNVPVGVLQKCDDEVSSLIRRRISPNLSKLT